MNLKLYTIGPITGKPKDNKPLFKEVQRTLKAHGYTCLIPHDYVLPGTDWKDAMCISITAMLRLNQNDGVTKPAFDGIAMLDGWEESRGARIEHELAEIWGIPCKPWREWIKESA